MTDILTLEDARAAINLPAADTSADSDLEATYIPMAQTIVEDIAGPVMQASRVFTADGGQDTILLPSAVVSVESVEENGEVLVAGTDYTVSLSSGWVARGSSTQTGATFAEGLQNVVISYTAGPYATTDSVPANIREAARLIVAQNYQADHQGYRPDLGAGGVDEVVETPSGFAVPRRAYQALLPSVRIPGFA